MYFVEGLLLGLGMVIFIGPVFFMLLTSSLNYGFKSGIAVAAGVFVSDILCVLICYFGFYSFLERLHLQTWFSILGALVLAFIGASYLFKEKKVEEKQVIDQPTFKSFFTKGFVVNFVNPFVFLIWIGVIDYSVSSWGKEVETSFYLLGVLLGILVTDVSKVFLADKLKALMNPKKLYWIYKIAGLVLVGFSIRLLYLIYLQN